MVAYLNSGTREIYDLGFGPRAFVAAPRALDVAQGDYLDPISGTFSLIGHGYDAGDSVRFVLLARGALPQAASLLATYAPIPIDYWRFRLAATPGGPALTFGDVGSGWALQVDPERRLMRIAENVSRDIDQDLTAHATPIQVDPGTGKYPDKLVGIVARETARRACVGLVFDNAAFRTAKERVDALQKQDDEQRSRWFAGQPINPRPVDQDSVPDNAAIADVSRQPTAWRTGVL